MEHAEQAGLSEGVVHSEAAAATDERLGRSLALVFGVVEILWLSAIGYALSWLLG